MSAITNYCCQIDENVDIMFIEIYRTIKYFESDFLEK